MLIYLFSVIPKFQDVSKLVLQKLLDFKENVVYEDENPRSLSCTESFQTKNIARIPPENDNILEEEEENNPYSEWPDLEDILSSKQAVHSSAIAQSNIYEQYIVS